MGKYPIFFVNRLSHGPILALEDVNISFFLSPGRSAPSEIYNNKSRDNSSHNAVSDRKGVEIYNNKISIASSQVGMLLSAEKQPFFCSQTQGTQSNHCKVYNESDDVGWTVDLSSFTCFEEL